MSEPREAGPSEDEGLVPLPIENAPGSEGGLIDPRDDHPGPAGSSGDLAGILESEDQPAAPGEPDRARDEGQGLTDPRRDLLGPEILSS
jgi:hypothetical protein